MFRREPVPFTEPGMPGWTQPDGSPTPPDLAPGYQDAVTAGRLPRVPATPPTLLPGRTAGQLFFHGIGAFFAAFPIIFTVTALTNRGVLPSWLDLPLFWLVAGGALWFTFKSLRDSVNRSITECYHGYTTSELSFGRAWWGGRRFPRTGGRGPDWDFGGVWFVAPYGGKVGRRPLHRGHPPGLYPSPTRLHQWELWTGAEWTGVYREPPAPHVFPVTDPPVVNP